MKSYSAFIHFPFASSEAEMPLAGARLRGVSTSLDTNGEG
ncbi:hypothetical protein J2X44_002606 [Sphingopyxis sp. BE259]|nr:hypothetical protein [Sphingopyxis sp. BE122]MDR7228070.1 hypothetical protein [Sphingopyxis sp. BE259]